MGESRPGGGTHAIIAHRRHNTKCRISTFCFRFSEAPMKSDEHGGNFYHSLNEYPNVTPTVRGVETTA